MRITVLGLDGLDVWPAGARCAILSVKSTAGSLLLVATAQSKPAFL